MVLIYEAVGLPRHRAWTFPADSLPADWPMWVAEYRAAFQEAGVDASYVTARLDGPAHLPETEQLRLIHLRIAPFDRPEPPQPLAGDHVLEYGMRASIAARERLPGAPVAATTGQRPNGSARTGRNSASTHQTRGASQPVTTSGSGIRAVYTSTAAFSDDIWTQLDHIDLVQEFGYRVDTFTNVPQVIRNDYRWAQKVALARFAEAHADPALGPVDAERAAKLHLLLPRMLLNRTEARGQAGRVVLEDRIRRLQQGSWASLIREAPRRSTATRTRSGPAREVLWEARLDAAERMVCNGELSRAARILTATGLAPGNAETLAKLRDPVRRPPAPTKPIRPGDLNHEPEIPLALDPERYLENIRSAQRGIAAGPSGTRNEHQRELLEDITTTDNLVFFASRVAVGDIPEAIRAGLAVSRLTALAKVDQLKQPTGDIRGIATGACERRVIARTIAQQYAAPIMEATSPFQYALSTRAGVDCVALLIRLLTDADSDKVVSSLDGIGAYDHVQRSAFFRVLAESPALEALLPFVRLWYGQDSTYTWTDQEGTTHTIQQGEGVEQGDPLAPALFSLAIHAALVEASQFLQPGESIFAFLDDVYSVTAADRAAIVAAHTARCIQQGAGVEPKLGKFAMWSRAGGPEPPGIRELLGVQPSPDREPVWKGDLPPERNGVVILGTPVGQPEFVRRFLRERISVEQELWDILSAIPNVQVAWLLLLFCSAPRANHLLRALPPDLVLQYAQEHDDGVWDTFLHIIGYRPCDDDPHIPTSRLISFLPLVEGGLGLRSAELTAPAAYWAAWADIIPTIAQRYPHWAQTLVPMLEQGRADVHCVAQAAQASTAVEGPQFPAKPSWQLLLQGERPPAPPPDRQYEPGVWPHGWQFYANSGLTTLHKERVVFPSLDPASQARLRSQGGSAAGDFLRALPVDEQLRIRPERFNLKLRRRARLPLPPLTAQGGCQLCPGCHTPLDLFGDHLSSCPWTGRLKRRGTAVEHSFRPLWREAPIRVGEQPFVRNLLAAADPQDERQADAVIRGASLGQGLPVVVDCTMNCAIHADGTPWPGASTIDGTANRRGEYRKRVLEYPDLATSSQIEYLVLAVEEGGRWGDDVHRLVKDLVKLKTVGVHPLLRRAAALAYTRRWWSLLSVGVQTAAVDCILGRDSPPGVHGTVPSLANVLTMADVPPEPSRMA